MMSCQVEVIESSGNIELLNDLWSSPNSEALGLNWRISDKVWVGLASQNKEKIDKVEGILRQHGSQLNETVESSETVIKTLLIQLWRNRRNSGVLEDGFRVANIACLKSLSKFGNQSVITHCLGLDTDVIALGANFNEPAEPIGRPESLAGLMQMLGVISGRTLEVRTAAALADVKAGRILAVDEVRILLKLRKFGAEEYLDTIGTGLVGQIPGAVDFSDQKSTNFLDPDFILRVSRMNAFPEKDTKKLAWVEPKAAAIVLNDYFKGCPAHLINSVIFNGLRAKYYQPFPFLS